MAAELLSQQEFKRVSQLAGLAPQARAQAYAKQLEGLLRHFSSVQQVKTKDNASHPQGPFATLRNDAVEQSMPREALLRTAPASQDGYIKVKPVA